MRRKSQFINGGSRQPPSLPLEIIELISDFLFTLRPPEHSGNVENETICCVKPSWNDVKGFMQASPGTHKLGFERWVSVLTIRDSQDWEVAFRISHLIRELVCLEGTIIPSESSILARFHRLRAVCVDSHEDVRLAPGSHQFDYRDVFSSLPPTVQHLEVKHAHGPDVHVIQCVKRHCPELESLWLGRCTVFNRPGCSFWNSFPLDHDAYITNRGTDAYAHSLGGALFPLQSLKSIRLGIYVVPTTVLMHRLFHTWNLPVPPVVNWQALLEPPPNANQNEQNSQPQLGQISDLITLLHRTPEEEICEQCWQEFFAGTHSAEISATRILKERLPSLEWVGWMDWFTPLHLGVRFYLV
ncbi:unnamed protein product [Rhizoctonia solani]|uniref:Uncharacterized protein n=1 Tax=Rhizoctonia solani TaxID=456999 RepID=A0A8H2WY72_9AGAM|nr:unnamed protein product [Rhizoctonia solani]